MKQLYIIAGCNGAGKTTASYTILPEILDCKEFVNADEIARGLSPFNAQSVNLQAGRLMLERVGQLLEDGHNFAIETTLSTRSYQKLIKESKQKGYYVTLLFFWLSSSELAKRRVETRVKEGGHDIPTVVIERRYHRGLSNFFKLYRTMVDEWMFINNSGHPYQILAQGTNDSEDVHNTVVWTELNQKYR